MRLRIFRTVIVISIFLSVAFPAVLHAQNKTTIIGTVKDKRTGESLIGASIKIEELPGTGVATNSYGYYAVSIPQGKYTLMVSFAGYINYTKKVNSDSSIQLNIDLVPASVTLEEVTVSTRKKNENIAKALMGVEKLNISEINQLPVLFGEKDVLKSIQLLPGIQSAGDGNSGFFVRGGAADQNLILLDEAPVYNASHLLGFFSTFNSDAIKDISLYKGGMPAQYGGRLSSVVDIKMKDGNNKDYDINGGIGLISSRLNIEGPIVKDNGSFIISGRRT